MHSSLGCSSLPMGVSLSLHLIYCVCGMSPIFGLFLIMATAAHGSAGSDSDVITHYVALGRPAFIQLINGASGYELWLKKDGNVILMFKKDKTTFVGNWESQFNFYTNGTLMIIKAERSLSGIYTSEIYDSNGKSLRTERFRLTIEGSAGSDSDNKTHHVALGRPAFIQLINGASGYVLILKKDGNVIFKFKKDKTTFLGNWESQFNFYTNGTLMIIKTERSLSGNYTSEIFDSNGNALPWERFRLIIEEPVTLPALSSLCLPHGELRVSCSSAGDNPQYSWLLDGLLLNNSRPVYDDGKGAVILGKSTSGSLTCTAKNNVSEEKAAVTLPNCAAVDMMPMLFAALGTVVLLPVLTVGLYSYCRKRPHVQAEDSKPDTEDMNNTVTEVVYKAVTM
ncbi:T-cell surface antigen CD2-like isoform X7 [Brienomyrus brachyistius]|uniref:T-cell surface antigen CD2-like isoform X7 n=1 Tax=Brienomyrus brachyistius TaxID=42636 RepID=UPI0020B358BA|nr:T-cell surface antigen CD2-like isoform X7 [Brienomyrus brachyistius]